MTTEPIDIDVIQAMWDTDQDVEIFVPDLIAVLRTHVTERDMLREAMSYQRDELERLEATIARVKALAYNPDTGDMYADSAIVVDATVLQNALQEKS